MSERDFTRNLIICRMQLRIAWTRLSLPLNSKRSFHIATAVVTKRRSSAATIRNEMNYLFSLLLLHLSMDWRVDAREIAHERARERSVAFEWITFDFYFLHSIFNRWTFVEFLMFLPIYCVNNTCEQLRLIVELVWRVATTLAHDKINWPNLVGWSQRGQ